MSKLKAVRYHDFCAGHRVVGHESKCANLHGHNYRIHFHCEAEQGELDKVGRVIDFSVIKSTVCEWLENNWDHRMLLWTEDPYKMSLTIVDHSIVIVPFNPTAENMAEHLLTEVCPNLLQPLGIQVTKIQIDETRKCSVTCEV